MCRFTGEVERVSETRIYARMVTPGRQALVYAIYRRRWRGEHPNVDILARA